MAPCGCKPDGRRGALMSDRVILIPGAGVGGPDLWPMAWALRRRGFDARVFRCLTWGLPLAQSAARLQRWLAAQPPAGRWHLVGHSLGGLVGLRYLADFGGRGVGRFVTLGTPHTDVALARRLLRAPGGRWLIGRGVESALPHLPLSLPPGVEIGLIAGDRDAGLGRLVPRPNDMAIALAEALHPGIQHRVVLPVSHVGMLVSRPVIDQVTAFLHQGRFLSM